MAQNSQHAHILDSEDEIIDAIIPPISQDGVGEFLVGSSQNANDKVVNSGKFHILQNTSEEILNSLNAFPVLSASMVLEVSSSAPSINEVITIIPHLSKNGSNVETTQVKQKTGTNVTTRKQAASLVTTLSKNGNLRREPKIRYSTDFIKKLKLPGMHYAIHNSIEVNKGNIWILWSASIKPPTMISCTRQEITIAVGDTLITGVHAASLTVDRRELWNDMEEINYLNKIWLVIGDFNVVTCHDEKVGGLKPLKFSMLEFNNCLNKCGLIQSPKTGLEFSWCNNRDGRKRIVCNLDRVVFNDKWLEVFPNWGYEVGARGISDHGILYGASADISKPKNVPFRALKVWKTHPSFKQVIIDSWSSDIMGNPEEDVLKATILSDRNPLDLHLFNNIVTLRGKQEILLDQQKEIIRKKSRVKWLKNGAANTRFFHVNLKIRQAQNAIVELEKLEGGITSNQEEIADILVKNFEDKFSYQEVTFDNNLFNDIPDVVNEYDNSILEDTPKAEEIKEAVFDLNPDSAPGPDGFAGWFYREVWEIIGNDFIRAIQFWWSRGFKPNILNANFYFFQKLKMLKEQTNLDQLD
ncbi:uncharacterized protein LOC113315617 [Papaver somniferum]|uniref:uncharacterized protein LOC113315617 n=1 Tax=Papaver somniferum TaxID=3469 RepID=UPI000E7055CC|nr:uncharacterized protein LOC113315617 [Papaver somniferum]